MARYNGGMIDTTLPPAPDPWATLPAPDPAPLLEELASLRLENATLRAENAVSQKDYDDAVSAETIGEADVKAAEARLLEARLDFEYSRVEAPVSGIAGRSLPSEGTLISGPEVLLTRITQVDPIWVNFGIPDADVLRRCRELGILTVGTITTVDEAIAMEKAGVDVVVASGVDGIYPKGFAISTVEAAERGPGLHKMITVRPAVDFSSLEEVLVVLVPPRGATAEEAGAAGETGK